MGGAGGEEGLVTRRYGLRDDQWARMEHLLPGRAGHVGGTARDNRLFVEAVLYRYRAGIPWRDLPERFGGWKRILQTPSAIAILQDDLTYRVIHTDGRQLEAEPAPAGHLPG